MAVSSIGGISAFPTVGIYNASKFALEGMSQALAAEVKGFGISVTLIEPAGYSTDWSTDSAQRATALNVYDEMREAAIAMRASRQSAPGNPLATRTAILKVVDAEHPPLRVFFGESPLALAEAEYAARIAEWEAWQPVSIKAQGTQPAA